VFFCAQRLHGGPLATNQVFPADRDFFVLLFNPLVFPCLKVGSQAFLAHLRPRIIVAGRRFLLFPFSFRFFAYFMIEKIGFPFFSPLGYPRFKSDPFPSHVGFRPSLTTQFLSSRSVLVG